MGRTVPYPVGTVAMEKLVIMWTVHALMVVQKERQEISVKTVCQLVQDMLFDFNCV